MQNVTNEKGEDSIQKEHQNKALWNSRSDWKKPKRRGFNLSKLSGVREKFDLNQSRGVFFSLGFNKIVPLLQK